jgi:Glycosyltransferase family 87
MGPAHEHARSWRSPPARPQAQNPRAEDQAGANGHRDCRSTWSRWRFFLGPGLTLIVASTLAPLYLTAFWPPASRVVDFFQEWASARNYREGLPLYTPHSVTIPRYLGPGISTGEGLMIEVNAHPPPSVLLALPFSLLGYPAAVLAWNLASFAMLGASLYLLWRGLEIPFTWWGLFPLTTALILCTPLFLQFSLGQLTLLILLLLTGTWAADRSARPFLAGALLGTATAIKLFPGFMFLYFLTRREWKVLIAGALSMIAVTSITVSLFGWEPYQAYFLDVLPKVARFRPSRPNASLVGLWAKLFEAPPRYLSVQPLCLSTEMMWSGIVASCAPILITMACIARRAQTQFEQDHAFGLSLTAMLLVAPITWDHYLLLLALPVAATWLCLPRTRTARILFALILTAFWFPALLMYELTIPGGLSVGIASPLHTVTILAYQCYALVALFGLEATIALCGTLPARPMADASSHAASADETEN